MTNRVQRGIEANLSTITNYRPEAFLPWRPDHFDDKAFHLTIDAMGKYMKRVKIRHSKLVEYLIENYGSASIFPTLGTFSKAGCDIKNWYLMQTGLSLQKLIFYCAECIRFADNQSLTKEERDWEISGMTLLWRRHFIDFSAHMLDVETIARKKSGNITFEKTKQPIKDWCLPRAYELRKQYPKLSKRRIVDKLLEELFDEKCPKQWPKGVIPLSQDNAYETIFKDWLPKGKPCNWPDSV